ncbi:hypothetical protein ACHAW5_010019 [Stephanodiscus triporus]|uniref:Uncharacterized protein n=1 Tax=Stephanodiscus triporus TaxID=2934178 RepID=A0ABD3NBI9_9STRA
MQGHHILHNLGSQARNHTAVMEKAPEIATAPGCVLNSNEDVAEAESSLADEATSDLEPACRGNKEIEQDITLEDAYVHSNLRGATANAESMFDGSTQREETTPNIMNLEAKASGGDTSITEHGVQDDLSMDHGGQGPEVVARGKSHTEDTDSVGMAGEEVARPKQARLAPEAEPASVEVDGLLFEAEHPEEKEEQADLDRLEKERLDGDQARNHTAMMEKAPEIATAPGCVLNSNEDVAEAESSLADEATSDLEPACRGNKEIEQDITLEDAYVHSNLRGATANAESMFDGSTQREETTPNIMNLEAKASGGDTSITEHGVQDDLSMDHGGQGPEVVARGKSHTEDTDSVGMAEEEVARPKQARLAPEAEPASTKPHPTLNQHIVAIRRMTFHWTTEVKVLK